ncbi:YfgM family protein [Necropsobacter massiliensis]|uniref:YfgM family protein n=1 Tax=Necropsobacter massiliensis TaxID=1400001 RepID=UPI0005963A43|nr:tetratricopeptide repeat protein [Necropsobacter massiliensis]
MAYTVEEEQELNELKNWWRENYKSIIVIVVLTFAGVFGWRYWQDHQISKMQRISAQYDQLIYSAQQEGGAQNTKLAQFVKENGKTSYAVFALLDAAGAAVNKQDFTQAEDLLKQAVSASSDDILLSLSSLRLAAVQLQQQQFDAALESLKQVKGQGWENRKNLMSGDILLAKGDKAGAKAHFEQALQNAGPLEAQLIQVRLNNL